MQTLCFLNLVSSPQFSTMQYAFTDPDTAKATPISLHASCMMKMHVFCFFKS